MPVGGAEGVVGLVLVAVFLPLVAALRDWRSQPRDRWHAAGASRWTWLAVIVLVPLLGPASYARRARPRLRAARDR